MSKRLIRINAMLIGVFAATIAATLYIATLSAVPFFTRGEAREALVVQSMFQQDNFVLPLRNGVDVPSKPPMFHWSAALSSRASAGTEAWWLRLPSALYASLAIGVLAAFALRYSGLKVACLSALLLASSFEWMRAASSARVDMTFAFFFGLSVYLGFLVVQCRESLGRWTYWLLVVATGLAATGSALAKGPAGLLLPFIVVGAVAVVRAVRQRKVQALSILPLLEAFLLALVLAAAWYIYAYLLHGEKFLYRQILFENVARVVEIEGKDVGHKKPFYFSVVYLFAAFQPWALLAGFPLLWLWDKRRELLQRDELLLAVLWVLAFLAAVTISVSKRQVYFLPALPPLAYLSALALADRDWLATGLERYRRGMRILGLCAAATFFLLALLLLLLYWLPQSFSAWLGGLLIPDEPSLFAMVLKSLQSFSAIALCAAAALSSWLFAQRIEGNRILFPLSTMAIVSLAISLFVQKQVFELESERIGAFEFAAEIKEAVAVDAPLYQFKGTFFPVNFYLKRAVPVLKASSRVLSDGSGYLLVWEGHLEELRMLGVPFRELLKSHSRAANGDGPLVLLYFGKAEVPSMSAEAVGASDEDELPLTSQPMFPARSPLNSAVTETEATAADEQRVLHQPDSTLQHPEVVQQPEASQERDQSALESTEYRPLPPAE